MKNKIRLIILIIFATFQCSYAQQRIEPSVSIGAKAGITLSKTNFSPSIPQSWAQGYMGGIVFRYTEEKVFGLIAELNIEQRGWKEKFEDTNYQYERDLTYLQIPILTHIYFGNNKIKGFFNLGPEFGFMIGDSFSSNFDINNTQSIKDFPKNHRTAQYTENINSKFDYGISAGMGIESIIKKKNSIFLEGRFYYGLGNIFSSHKTDYFSASPGMSIMVSLGYMYKLK